MSHTEAEIRSQPEAWRRVLDLLPTVADALPVPGERVATIGCGTSWFIAEAYAALREEGGLGETDPFTASALPSARRYDRVVALSRSGTTTEVLRAVDALSVPVTAIVADPTSPLVGAVDETIALDFADERSVVQTVFATSAFVLLRASLGHDMGPVIAETAGVLDLDRPVDAAAESADQITFLGEGWVHGLAREAALKLREASQAWTEAYPQLEYRHGPISIAQPGRVVWVFGAPVPGIVDEVRATGATVVCDDLDPLTDLVRAQLTAVRRAELGGLDPDRPRHLTRSVILF
jgi:fructoselysine-6-P-deglycase FrlB-like protein